MPRLATMPFAAFSVLRAAAGGLRHYLLLLLVLVLFGGGVRAAELTPIEKLRQSYVAGDYEKVLAESSKAIREGEFGDDWRILQAESLMTLGRYAEAVTAVSNSLARYSFSVRLRMLAYELLRMSNRPAEAREQLEAINQLWRSRSWAYRDSAPSIVVLAKAALIMEVDAKDVLDKLLTPAKKIDPKAKEPFLAIGEIALSKSDYALASKTFEEAIKIHPEDPDLLKGYAASMQEDDREKMIEALSKALDANPNHVPSHLLLTDHLVDAEHYDDALKQLEKVEKVNPLQPEAAAYRAIVAHLRNEPSKEGDLRKKALSYWTNNPAVDHLIGRKLSQKYRFAEGAAYQKRALAFDPDFTPAKIQLGQDLLRLGKDAEGWALVEEAHKADGYNIESFNLVTLKDSMAKFATLSNKWFILRMTELESKVYGERALALLERARTNLCEKYDLKLDQPVVVEIFNDQKDFGVRTFGMPLNPGFLGVCFGHVITANSPASGTGTANWEATLWHEFCHVITLGLTKNKMPRWLSEGISVYEELQQDPNWGQHLTPIYREMILGKALTPVSELSGAFMKAKDGQQIQFAYFESAMVVEFLVKRFGFDALKKILNDLGAGTEINAALSKHTLPIETLDKEFADYARGLAKAYAPELDWTKPTTKDPLAAEALAALNPKNYYVLKAKSLRLIREKKYEEALEALLTLRKLFPRATGDDGALALLAKAYRELKQPDKEREALEARAGIEVDAYDTFFRLMQLASERKDWPEVAKQGERALAVNPLRPEARRLIGEAYGQLQKPLRAAEEWQAVLAMNPADPAEVHFKLASSLRADATKLGVARRHLLQAIDEAPRFRAALALLDELPAAPISSPPSSPIR